MLKSSRSKTVAALLTLFLVVLTTAGSQLALAADDTQGPAGANSTKDDGLDEVVVTGSLIHQRVETATPVTVITGEEISERGFSSIAEALQHTSFATGSVQGSEYVGGFTQGAKTLSLFGLSPSYTKYLIDGRPLADYPALYNGTDTIVSIAGIPTVLVDHIDVLPGGQSSIYGSDAIAGVINVILKQKTDGPIADVRYGWTHDGGGTDKRIAAADSFSFGSVNVFVGGQYEKTDPIWSNQRNLTKSYYAQGTSAQTAERDFLLYGYFGPNGDGSNAYYFQDPANCANVAGLFGNSVRQATRPDRGMYCGTTNPSPYTVGNGDESTQGYLNITDDISDNVQVFANVLVNHDVTRLGAQSVFFATGDDPTSPYYYYEDPNIPDLLNVQRIFSPEEEGGRGAIMDKDTNNTIRGTLGVQGHLGASNWHYIVDMTYTENKLTELRYVAFTSAINNFFAPIFGPTLGYDPDEEVNIFSPNYANFYKPITFAQFQSFSGYTSSYSRTEDSLARAQLTNSKLFSLPAGDVGVAVQVEGGAQGWEYDPDPRFLDGDAYLDSATAGSGHRSRYAGTAEVRVPIVTMLTADLSGRYDDYKLANDSVGKGTYNAALEFRPVSSLLIRGRYGTAFKAPTLADEYQGPSGYYETLTDYYACAKEGYSGTTLGNCPQSQQSYSGITTGNTQLKPITAKVSDVGAVWTPLPRLSFSVDYIHFDISNEINVQSADQLLSTDSECLLGTLDAKSPTCVAAISQVARDSNGVLLGITTPKINVSKEKVNVLTLAFSYGLDIGPAGSLVFDGSFSDILKHDQVLYQGDPVDDLLNDPINSQEFKTKENGSVTWNFHDFGTTAYIESYGKTPNYLATIYGYGTTGAARLGTWTLVNWSARYQVISGLTLSFNVDNVFNKSPPQDHSYPGTEEQPYDVFDYSVLGRSFFVEANYKFGR